VEREVVLLVNILISLLYTCAIDVLVYRSLLCFSGLVCVFVGLFCVYVGLFCATRSCSSGEHSQMSAL